MCSNSPVVHVGEAPLERLLEPLPGLVEVLVLEDEPGLLLGPVHDDGEEQVRDGGHPDEDRGDGRQDELPQVGPVPTELGVDDVVRDDGEGDQEEGQLQRLNQEVEEGHQHAPPPRSALSLLRRVILFLPASVFDAAPVPQSHPVIWIRKQLRASFQKPLELHEIKHEKLKGLQLDVVRP